MKTVQEEEKAHNKRFHNRLSSNNNTLICDLAVLTIPGNPPRRLKRVGVVTFLIPKRKFKIKKY